MDGEQVKHSIPSALIVAHFYTVDLVFYLLIRATSHQTPGKVLPRVLTVKGQGGNVEPLKQGSVLYSCRLRA
jgi:hypothetical protein